MPTGPFAINDLLKMRLNVPADRWLSPGQIAEKPSEKGYKIVEIVSDDGAYEVEMIDKNGIHIGAHVPPEPTEMLYGYDD